MCAPVIAGWASRSATVRATLRIRPCSCLSWVVIDLPYGTKRIATLRSLSTRRLANKLSRAADCASPAYESGILSEDRRCQALVRPIELVDRLCSCQKGTIPRQQREADSKPFTRLDSGYVVGRSHESIDRARCAECRRRREISGNHASKPGGKIRRQPRSRFRGGTRLRRLIARRGHNRAQLQ
jgi:hypothetical protein